MSSLFLWNVIGKELLLDIMLFFLCIQTQIGKLVNPPPPRLKKYTYEI